MSVYGYHFIETVACNLMSDFNVMFCNSHDVKCLHFLQFSHVGCTISLDFNLKYHDKIAFQKLEATRSRRRVKFNCRTTKLDLDAANAKEVSSIKFNRQIDFNNRHRILLGNSTAFRTYERQKNKA